MFIKKHNFTNKKSFSALRVDNKEMSKQTVKKNMDQLLLPERILLPRRHQEYVPKENPYHKQYTSIWSSGYIGDNIQTMQANKPY